MLLMPVSVQSYECCPVVAGWCLMLCHTQCNHSQTWNEQWHGTASRVCLCPLPFQVSDHSDEVESLLTLCLQHTDVFLKWEVWVPPEPKELRGLLHRQKCVSNPHKPTSLWARDRGAMKFTTLHLWAANLKPFLVAHSCIEFTACCRCLSMVSRERPRKQIARSSTKSALKMSLAIQEGSSLIFSP